MTPAVRARRLCAPLILVGLAAGCGGSSPSAPSTTVLPPGVNVATTQGIVGAALAQAATPVITVAPDGSSRSFTFPCPNGGSITTTSDVTPPAGQATTMTSSSRMEFSDCRSGTVTMNGDPYISMDNAYVIVRGADGALSSMTATSRMTGGVRFSAGTTEGRSRYDCTLVMSFQVVNGIPSMSSMTSSGTITWEQPLGTVTVRACGT